MLHSRSTLVQNIVTLPLFASAHNVGLAQGLAGYHIVVVVATSVTLRLGDLVLGASDTFEMLTAGLSSVGEEDQ